MIWNGCKIVPTVSLGIAHPTLATPENLGRFVKTVLLSTITRSIVLESASKQHEMSGMSQDFIRVKT